MTLSELFDNSELSGETPVSGIFCNSQKIKPGGIFVCLVGENDDGHNYAKDAERNGAAAIAASKQIDVGIPVIYYEDTSKALAELAEKFYGYPAKQLKLIGVTGTNGKTTVTHLIKSILEASGKNVGLIGTNRYSVGKHNIEYKSSIPTTPNALELAELFRIMLDEGAEYVVMEVSSHALSLNRVYGLEFEVGVFTNLTRDHLDFHKTMDNYLKAKEKLFDLSKTAVINSDTAAGMKILKNCRIPAITVGVHDAVIRASLIKLGNSFVEFTAEENGIAHTLTMPIPGKFSVYNALCAVGAARAAGIDYNDICTGLASVGTVKGRVELVPTNTDFKVFIDYAHSPDSLSNILHTVRGFTKGRVIALFGCGGDRDSGKREPMGKIAGSLADFSIITSDNPRCENPIEIIEEIKTGMDKSGGEYIIIVNRREAIEYALSIAQKDDTVILCGKGQETYQIIGHTKIHFDEREIVEEYFKNNGG